MGREKLGRKDRQLSPEKTKAIIEGAMQEFSLHGYAATSMDRIAIAAKVSKATVYSHFQDKESLFVAIVQHLVEQRFQLVFGDADERMLQMPPRVVLKNLANRMLDLGDDKPQFLNFMRLILGESGRFPQLARVFVRNIEQTLFSKLCYYFTNCPQLELDDPKATTRIFVGTIVHFLIVQEMLHGKDIVPIERDRIVDALTDLIVGKQSRATARGVTKG